MIIKTKKEFLEAFGAICYVIFDGSNIDIDLVFEELMLQNDNASVFWNRCHWKQKKSIRASAKKEWSKIKKEFAE